MFGSQVLRLLAEHRSGKTTIPTATKPVAVPAPLTAVPSEATDAEIAVGIAVNRPPEKNSFTLPTFRNEARILQEEVQQIGVEGRLGLELLTEVIAADYFAIPLFLGEIGLHFRGVKLKLTTSDVFFHLPTGRNVGGRIQVNQAFHRFDFRAAKKHLADKV